MASDDAKRGKVTDENRQEALALKAIWTMARDRLKAAGLASQEAFGAEFKIGNQAAVGFFLNGKTALSPKAAAGFARGLNCQVADFSPRLAALLQAPTSISANASISPIALETALPVVVQAIANLPPARWASVRAQLEQLATAPEMRDDVLVELLALLQAPPAKRQVND